MITKINVATVTEMANIAVTTPRMIIIEAKGKNIKRYKVLSIFLSYTNSSAQFSSVWSLNLSAAFWCEHVVCSQILHLLHPEISGVSILFCPEKELIYFM